MKYINNTNERKQTKKYPTKNKPIQKLTNKQQQNNNNNNNKSPTP